MEHTHTPQRALIKLLAIIGLFALIALIIWAVVQGVRAFPSAFSSLASITETISNYRPDQKLGVTVEKNIVNSGENFTIQWNDMGSGSYIFNYECVEGVQFSVRTDQGNLQKIECTEELNLPSNVHGLFASIESTEQRFNDVTFTLTFKPEEGTASAQEHKVTVVNATVPQNGTQVTQVPATEDEPEVSQENENPEPPVSIPRTPALKPSVSTPSPKPAVIAYFPPSLPNGEVDLKITYLGVGTISRGNFIPTATFDDDDRAAFRFEVKNVGTKTSDSWSYDLTLPGNVDYRSGSQAALLPNERVVFTVGFDLNATRNRSVNIEAEVHARGDSNSRNDSFDWSVKVVK